MRRLTQILCSLLVVFLLAAALRTAFAAECRPTGGAGSADELEALYSQLETMPRPRQLDFDIGRQQVFYFPVGEFGAPVSDAQIRGRLTYLRDKIATLADQIGASASNRPVYLWPTNLDIEAGTLAFADCHEQAEPLMTYALGGETIQSIPGNACMMVVFPQRIDNLDDLDYVLAHEWMHTMQTGVYGPTRGTDTWWREGSAEWFAHTVKPGRDVTRGWVERFGELSDKCPLSDLKYEAQVFFFWGERAFDRRWIFELGLGGGDYLRSTARAAQIIAPEHWQSWARALADHSVTYPDARPLPRQVDAPPVTLAGRNCPVTVEGPALSAQLRKLYLGSAAPGDKLIVETDGLVAVKAPDGTWANLPAGGGSVDVAGAETMTLAGISPSARPFAAELSVGTPGGICQCHVGRWMETGAAGGFRFRGSDEGGFAIPGAGTMTARYASDGPIITIAPDGTYTVDDPGTYAAFTPEGTEFWRLDQSVKQERGEWRFEDGVLSLRRLAKVEKSTLTVNGVASPYEQDRQRTGQWIRYDAECSQGRLQLWNLGMRALAAGRPPEEQPTRPVLERIP